MSPTATNQPAPIKAVRSLSSDANLLKARRKNRWSLFFGFGTDHKTNQSPNSTRSLPSEMEQPVSAQPLSAPQLVSDEPDKSNLYSLLGVKATASSPEIKEAFRVKALELVIAYQILSDDKRRRDYDKEGNELVQRFAPDLSDTSLFDCVFQQTEGTNVQEVEDQPIVKVSRPAPTASNPHTFIPAYFYPGEIWSRSLQQPSNVEYMVMNPNSGPGDAPNPHYIQQIKEAQRAGIKILGYVHTSYGKRSPTLVRKEITLFMEWYKVDGIFLDEVPSSRLDLPYFQSLAVYIRSLPGPLIVINPGVYPDEGYMQVCDIVLAYENAFSSYNALDVPGWVFAYPAHKFIHMVHTTPEGYFTLAAQLASERNAGHVFFTDALMPNPYDKLPTYFAKHKAL